MLICDHRAFSSLLVLGVTAFLCSCGPADLTGIKKESKHSDSVSPLKPQERNVTPVIKSAEQGSPRPELAIANLDPKTVLLTASTDMKRYFFGNTIKLNWSLRNLGNAPITVPVSETFGDVYVQVEPGSRLTNCFNTTSHLNYVTTAALANGESFSKEIWLRLRRIRNEQGEMVNSLVVGQCDIAVGAAKEVTIYAVYPQKKRRGHPFGTGSGWANLVSFS